MVELMDGRMGGWVGEINLDRRKKKESKGKEKGWKEKDEY